MAQSLLRNKNSKQQFVLTNFVETPLIPNFKQVVKNSLQVFKMLLLRKKIAEYLSQRF